MFVKKNYGAASVEAAVVVVAATTVRWDVFRSPPYARLYFKTHSQLHPIQRFVNNARRRDKGKLKPLSFPRSGDAAGIERPASAPLPPRSWASQPITGEKEGKHGVEGRAGASSVEHHGSSTSRMLEMAGPGEPRERKRIPAKAVIISSGPFRYLVSR